MLESDRRDDTQLAECDDRLSDELASVDDGWSISEHWLVRLLAQRVRLKLLGRRVTIKCSHVRESRVGLD